MTKIRWSPQAADDLEAIHDFIALDSPPYASLVVQRIFSVIEGLASFPQLGRVVPEVGDAEVREQNVGAFRVVYRCRDDCVEIITVFRATRLFPIERF